jgi:putative protease
VLARELHIKEIEEIKKKVPGMELEIFVHGAMCMTYS